jgi:hypothetical protein
MKTPDEIKKALECCFNASQCADCPYYPTTCDRELVRDAREYIRQLEADNARQDENIRVLELSQQAINATNMEQEHKIWQLEAERDAAVADLTEIVHECGEPCCEYCEWNGRSYCAGRCWTHNEGFKWRGVQKEG